MADVMRRREYWMGLVATATTLATILAGTWPVPDKVSDESTAALLLGDPVVVGVLRLAIVVVALYGIASVPALILGGRWARGVGTTGIVADDPRGDVVAVADARQKMAALAIEIERLSRERDEWMELVESETRQQYDG